MWLIQKVDQEILLAYHEKEDLLYFCSEKKMLDWLLDRTMIDHTIIFEPKPNQHFKWNLSKSEDVKNFDVKAFAPYKSPVYNNSGGYNNNVSRLPAPYVDSAGIPTLSSIGLHSGQRILCEKYEIVNVNHNANRCTVKGMCTNYNFEVIAYNVTNTFIKDLDLFAANVSSVNQRLSSAGWATVTLTAVTIPTDEEIAEYKKGIKEAAEGGASKKLCDKGCDEICPECRKDVEGGVSSEKKPGSSQDRCESEMAQKLAETNATPYVQGPRGILIQQSEYDDLTKHGCANCSADLLSPSEVCWTYMEDPLCERCNGLVGSMWANFGDVMQ